MKLDTGTALSTVIQPLTPFTFIQVLLVLQDDVPIIMKFYDPHFLCQRQPSKHWPCHFWDRREAFSQTTPDPNFDFCASQLAQRSCRMGDDVLSADGIHFPERERIVHVSSSFAGAQNPSLLWATSFLKIVPSSPHASCPMHPRCS